MLNPEDPGSQEFRGRNEIHKLVSIFPKSLMEIGLLLFYVFMHTHVCPILKSEIYYYLINAVCLVDRIFQKMWLPKGGKIIKKGYRWWKLGTVST